MLAENVTLNMLDFTVTGNVILSKHIDGNTALVFEYTEGEDVGMRDTITVNLVAYGIITAPDTAYMKTYDGFKNAPYELKKNRTH